MKKIASNLPVFAATLLSALLICASCQRNIEEPPPPTVGPPVTIQLALSRDIYELVANTTDLFLATDPRVGDNQPIKVELIGIDDLQAANDIASGRLKVDGWLSPSPLFVNYAHRNLHNLGAELANCTPLFGSPIVAALSQTQASKLKLSQTPQRWASILTTSGKQNSHKGSRFAFAHPLYSTVGLLGYVEVALTALSQTPTELTTEVLDNPTSIKQLTEWLKQAEFHPHHTELLIQQAANKTSATELELPILFASEQQTRDYADRFAILYPQEGAPWLEYALCQSTADWVTKTKRSAIEALTVWMQRQPAQGLAVERGFRPLALTTEQWGESDAPNSKIQTPIRSAALAKLIELWPQVRRRIDLILVLDSSGAMEGESFDAGRSFFSRLINQLGSHDRAALITFSRTLEVQSALTTNTSQVIKGLGKATIRGGSALYDAIRQAAHLIISTPSHASRRSVVVFTRGDDRNSQVDRLAIENLWHSDPSLQRSTFMMIVLTDEPSLQPKPELVKFTQALGGSLHAVTLEELPQLLRRLEGAI